MIASRYMLAEDFQSVAFRVLADAVYDVYEGHPHPSGARDPEHVRMHITREWEYPWAILAADADTGDRVLDLGCGGSPLPVLFAHLGCFAIGMDNEDVISGKRPSLRSYGWRPPIEIVRADMGRSWPFAAESFDVVTCISVLESAPVDVWHVAREAHRVLRPGGRFVVTLDVDRSGTNPEHVATCLDVLTRPPGGFRIGPVDTRKPDVETLPCTNHVFGVCVEKTA